MQLSNEQALALVREGAELLQGGHPQEARTRFEQITVTGRANTQIWLFLAAACKASGDRTSEEAALDAALALDPSLIRGQIMKGDCRVHAGDQQGALEFYQVALRWAEAAEQLPPDLAAEVARARSVIAQYAAKGDAAREAALTARGLPPEARSPRFAEALDIMAGRKAIFVQQPTDFYFPGLAQTQFFDTAAFDWVPAVEAAAPAIRAELDGLLASRAADFRPYLHGDPNRARIDQSLLDDPDWSALFLCENGVRNEAAIEACPATWAAMQQVPFPAIANSPTVMFSLLRKGARIMPHTGMFNTRLVCHLPLIVPPDCHFRVGNEVRQWEQGKLLVFDDSIEHEAWNNSDQDRVVLIFDIWRPDLSEQEKAEVAALFAGKPS